MSIAKCIGVLIIMAVLLYLFIFNRKKMNQLSIAIALAYVILAGARLWGQRDDADLGEQLITIAIFFGGFFVLWAVLWASQRWADRKAAAGNKERTPPKRAGPPTRSR